MKKTLIAMFALAGMAMAADVYTDVLTLPASSTYWGKAASGDEASDHWSDSTSKNTISATFVNYAFVAAPNATTGKIYYGCANGNGYGEGDVVISTAEDKSISFNTTGRGGNGGEYVAITLSGADLIAGRESDKDTLTGVTFAFTNNVAAGAYSAWGYTDGDETVTKLSVNETAAGTNTITLTGTQLKDLDRVIFVIGNATSNTQVTNLSVTSTFTPAVPEPATATLSLLALAGLAARRRRH